MMLGAPHLLNIVVGLAVSSILFLGWELGSPHLSRALPSWRDDKALQFIVFGDSWVDNGLNALEASSLKFKLSSDQPRQKTWVDYLCGEIACTTKNFAASPIGVPNTAEFAGVFVDNTLHNDDLPETSVHVQTQADFTTQFQQWRQMEEAQTPAQQNQFQDDNSIFVIQFGLWDIWSSVYQSKGDAAFVINASIDSIFQALDVLADERQDSTSPRIILTLAPDVTFLPGYAKSNVEQRHAVALMDFWNTELSDRAESWGRGEIYLYDMNNFMLDHIRAQQMHSVGLSDSTGLGTGLPAFKDITNTCIRNSAQELGMATITCTRPGDFLFWQVLERLPFYCVANSSRDDFHLSPRAHELIAQEISADLRSQSGGWIDRLESSPRDGP